MSKRRGGWGIVGLLLLGSVAGFGTPKCIPSPNPPKLPMLRHSGRFGSHAIRLRVLQMAGLSDSWKVTRREIGSVAGGQMVEVLEDVIVVDAPDIVWVMQPVDELQLKEGDQMLRYAHLREGRADLWANGCWYEGVNADFVTEPDGGGCSSDNCSAKVSKPGRQTWWFRVKLPDGEYRLDAK